MMHPNPQCRHFPPTTRLGLPCIRRHDGGAVSTLFCNIFFALNAKTPQVHLTADVDRDGQHLGGGGGIDGKARTVGQILIKRKRPDGLAARCMFGERGSSNSSTDIEPSAVCIRTSKPFTVSVWSAGDFSLRDCPLSLMVAAPQFVLSSIIVANR